MLDKIDADCSIESVMTECAKVLREKPNMGAGSSTLKDDQLAALSDFKGCLNCGSPAHYLDRCDKPLTAQGRKLMFAGAKNKTGGGGGQQQGQQQPKGGGKADKGGKNKKTKGGKGGGDAVNTVDVGEPPV